MKKSLARHVVEDVLSDDARVIVFGLGDNYFKQAKAAVESGWSGIVGPSKISEEEIEQKMKGLKKDVLSSMGAGVGLFMASRHISENYKYLRAPSIEMAAKTVDGYAGIVGSALAEREKIKYEYGTMARNAATGIYQSVLLGMGLVRAVKAANQARILGVGVGGILKAAGLSRGFMVLPKVTPTQVAHAIFHLVVVEALARAAQWVGETLGEGRATRLAIEAQAPAVLNPERLMEHYSSYVGTHLFQQGGYNVYSNLGSTLQSEYKGVSPEMFGHNYEYMIDVLSRMNTQALVNRNTYLDYATRTAQLSGIYGMEMTELMSSASRVVLGKDVEEASTLLQKFFSSMAGDGKLHLAQMSLVGDMFSFAEGYVLGKKFNIDGGGVNNLARVQAFSKSIYGDMHSFVPTETLVSGIDSVLQQGAFGSNPHMENIMARTGMTRGEALGGVTSSPETLERFLYGMYLELGIGAGSFDENGELSDADMGRYLAYTQYGLGMDQTTQRATYVAYRAFARGSRGEDVSTQYAEAFEEYASKDLPDYPLVGLAKNWTRGSVALTNTVFSYADILTSLGEKIMEITGRVGGPLLSISSKALIRSRDAALKSAGHMPSSYASSGGRGVSVGVATPPPLPQLSQPTGPATVPNYLSGSVSAAFAEYSRRFSSDDARFYGLSENAQRYNITLAARMAMMHTARVTAVGGLLYNSNHERLRGKENFGIDIVIGPSGSESPVYFPFLEGEVLYSGIRTNSRGEANYGLSVVVRLGGAYQVSFSHLSSSAVSAGDRVSRGDLIGYQGQTGLATGEHVDVEYRKGGGMSGTTHYGEIISDLEEVYKLFSPFLGEFSMGGAARPLLPSGGLGGLPHSQKTTGYVSMDLEVNGVDTLDFAQHLQSYFMRS